PASCYATCNCGKNPLKSLLAITSPTPPSSQTQLVPPTSQDALPGRTARRGTGSHKSARYSAVKSELLTGSLDPHTLIAPEAYVGGPDLRFFCKTKVLGAVERKVEEEKRGGGGKTKGWTYEVKKEDGEEGDELDKYSELGRHAGFYNIQPFDIVVNPSVNFVADLHSHLVGCEVIGFLGGRYDSFEKTIFVQAAFPCTSTAREDSGATDVEMDPVSQIVTRDAIARHGLEVVGWYHSHPAFEPDPSVTDIENQRSYQNLIKSAGFAKGAKEKITKEAVVPFVGLIVGTYDPRSAMPQSTMRWFHCKADTSSSKGGFPMQLETSVREYRDAGAAGREEARGGGRERRMRG
ncbi:hypothetical protein TrRE_jg1666, partial [Triparma retinervis]